MSLPRLAVWPPLPPAAWFRRPRPYLPFPLAEAGCGLYSMGRHALWHGVRALGLKPGDEVLMPAYNHGSEVEALERAGLGLRFYEARDSLEPDESELEDLRGEPTRALYLIHYLGFPQDTGRWRDYCDERGLLLVEDAAQAWLAEREGRPLGSDGDLVIFCLYKTFGLPDGAALLIRGAAPAADGRSLGLTRALRRNAGWLASRFGPLAPLGRPIGRRPVDEREFALGDPDSSPATASALLLPRVSDPGAARRRRDNYRALHEELGELTPPPFGKLPPGASPFAFPIEVERKEETLARLAAARIRGLDLWSIPHGSIPPELQTGSRRSRTIGLPVHQELRPSDLERIAETVHGRRRAPAPRLEPAEFGDLRAFADAQRNIFATPEFLALWWEHFGSEAELRLLAGPRTVLPLYRGSLGPLRVLRFLGHGAGDELGPVCAPSDLPIAASVLRAALAQERFDLFLGEHLPGVGRWADRLGARVLRRDGSPVIDFGEGGWEEFLAGQSSNFREQARRKERKLGREHDLQYRLATPDTLEADLDLLFALHRKRWAGAETTFSAREAFHRAFAARALERGWLRLWIMEVDGSAAAAWHGFRYGGAESYFQAGRDSAWDRYSVGFVLLCHTIRSAAEDGAGEYRLLRGGEEYKFRFAGEDPGLETVAKAKGPIGRTGLAAAAALDRSPAGRSLRRRLLA
jgi:perosamine synthetase